MTESESLDVRSRILVSNERRKLAASALDRLSTAFLAVGVLGQLLSITPATATFRGIIVFAGWVFGAFILHLIAQRILGGLKA